MHIDSKDRYFDATYTSEDLKYDSLLSREDTLVQF